VNKGRGLDDFMSTTRF